LRRATLADGVTEAAVAMLLESRRPPERQHLPWNERKRAAVLRGLDQLERDAAGLLGEQPSTTEISVGCALGYLDFRFPELQWRDGRPALADWYAGFSQRPSMLRTAPPGSTI
jgi:glutathione S-transferase